MDLRVRKPHFQRGARRETKLTPDQENEYLPSHHRKEKQPKIYQRSLQRRAVHFPIHHRARAEKLNWEVRRRLLFDVILHSTRVEQCESGIGSMRYE